jgi:prevent-host-death family protein
MATVTARRASAIVVSALNARTNFGKLLRRVDQERRSFVIAKRGTPAAILLSIRRRGRLTRLLRLRGRKGRSADARAPPRHRYKCACLCRP